MNSLTRHNSKLKKIVLVGMPNVGKSVLFNKLTGAYVTVSNYPGTTVDVISGKSKIANKNFEIIDTPGMYSLLPISDEERVTRDMLLTEHPEIVIHVADAKNLQRMLNVTIQLIEAGLPVMLVVNMLDEAKALGIKLNVALLGERLGVPVVGTAAAKDQGVMWLKEMISSFKCQQAATAITYDEHIEKGIAEIQNVLQQNWRLSKRALALLLLQEDVEVRTKVAQAEPKALSVIDKIVERVRSRYEHPVNFAIALQRQMVVDGLLKDVFHKTAKTQSALSEILNTLTMWPVTGIPILLAVLYFGLYKFVGEFGAGFLVNYIEGNIFEQYLTPLVNQLVQDYIPWLWLQTLIGGDYGIITLGIRYAVAIVLPIVGAFFLAFSIIEDSGYLPRLAMLVDRAFKWIGLNGRAVIPMTLGFGCDTMAVMVSRILETRRERIIATLLLSLAIPCSAQLGVVLGLLSQNTRALILWILFMVGVFILIGYLTAKLMPGERPNFYMEIPPLRMPKISNVLTKSYTRMYWYLLEIIPVFVLASVLIWLGKLTGLFDLMVDAAQPMMQLLGLPSQAVEAFIFGFFRRDYGAAGLYDLQQSGVLTGQQLLVAAVTLTLFVPCIAQFAMTAKERGWKIAVGMSVFIFPFAFFCGWVLHVMLGIAGISL